MVLPTSTSGNISSSRLGQHILVIRFSAMGDIAILVPVLRAVTTAYPALKITVLTSGFFAPLFNKIQNVEVYNADLRGLHGGIRGLWRLAQVLKKLNINAVADVHGVLRTHVLRSIFYFFGIPVKQIDKGRAEKKALTAKKNKIFVPLKATWQRYADVFAKLGYPIDFGKLQVSDKQKILPEILKSVGGDLVQRIGIAPFAQHNSKVYPNDLMEEVVRLLNAQPNLRIFLFGGGQEEIEKLDNLASKFQNIISIAGRVSFEAELAMISNLDVMLSMDSGNAHLAALYGIPVITLWGVTHPFAGFGAFGQPQENHLLPDLDKYPLIPTSVYGNVVPPGYEDVMRSIPPERVVKKILEVLPR